jgi:hypothetical protein
MSNVNCSDCGCELPDVNSGPCPNCGSINKTVQLQAHSQAGATASAKTFALKAVTEMKGNWKLICMLVVVNFISVVSAYFLSGFKSVIVNLVLIIASTIVGYLAITRVTTITPL